MNGRIPGQPLKIFPLRTTLTGRPKALTLVHGTTFGSQFTVGPTQAWIVGPHIEAQQTGFVVVLTTVKPPAGVPHQAGWLPDTHLTQLLWKAIAITRCKKSLHRQLGRSGMMPVGCSR